MLVSRRITAQLQNSSWIRRMFEEGARLRRERGADHVFDFSLGNPVDEPPLAVIDALKNLVNGSERGTHGYMPNQGLPSAREAVARKLARETGLPYEADDIVMTVGAAGACNIVLKALLDPGDEVILLAPYFAEYDIYVANHGGVPVIVETDDTHMPDVERIRRAITPRTRAMLINTPNNPSGRVYPKPVLDAIEAMLAEQDHPIAVLSDEPYKQFVYDGQRQPEVAASITNTIVCNSWSKSLGLAGERIGYVALSPRIDDRMNLRRACTLANRVLGFVNAPGIWQRTLVHSLDASVDAAPYEARRNALCDGLQQIGYEVHRPEGAFYVFLKTPIPDDVAFAHLLADEGVLTVPGVGFGRRGYVRLALTVTMDTVRNALPGFERALVAARNSKEPQPVIR